MPFSGNNITVIVENQTLDCVFQGDDERAAPAHYVGTLTKVGANLTINGPGDIVWLVAAATGHVGPGALAGDYAGPETTVKAGVGGGGALLVGGSDNTVSLQPLEVEGGPGRRPHRRDREADARLRSRSAAAALQASSSHHEVNGSHRRGSGGSAASRAERALFWRDLERPEQSPRDRY